MTRGSLKVFRIFLISLIGVLMAAAILPFVPVRTQAQEKMVRVGWYDSSYNIMDPLGRRSGYAYEYQLKIAAYTGWNYVYVDGSWSELMQMLMDGKIDLLSDVSYTEERTSLMLFPDLPMGVEEYYVFKSPGNQELSSSNPSTLNGKRVGVNKGSVQTDFFLSWAEEHHVHAELVELQVKEEEFIQMLENGELDAYVTVDSFQNPDCAVPLFKVGYSDYYFAVNKERLDLLTDLNNALSRIQEEDRFFNQRMFEQYMKQAGSNAYLSADEQNWLSKHGTIRVGYQDHYLAFCAVDPVTGELTGAMKDYLEFASGCLENAEISFEPKAFPTVEDAFKALKAGEIDCVFPANLGGYDAEAMGLLMTPSLMRTDMVAIVRQSELNSFARREHVTVAINEGNPNYEAFLLDYYPDWQKVYYKTSEDCLKAVSENVADCMLASTFRYNNISRLCSKYHLTTFPTGLGMDYYFAVGKQNTKLYSILTKVISQVPDSTVNTALSYYISEDARFNLGDFVSDNLGMIMAVIAIIILVFIVLMVRSSRAERKAKQLIALTETDTLTGLYNRDYFFEYANNMRNAYPDLPMDAIVFNIEKFHSINAVNGWAFGDQVLRALADEIRSIAMELKGIAGRFGADRFDIYCRHTEDYQGLYDRVQNMLDHISPNVSIRLRMGVCPPQKDLEIVQMFDRARTACSMVRGHYKEHMIIFDEQLQKRETYEQRLVNDLRRALERREFEVYYQPQYDIQVDPPKFAGAEALIRWNHPKLGMISPDDFIPLLEHNGMITEVDKYVWSTAAGQVAWWRKQFGVTVPMSVNLSRVDVFDPPLEDTLDEILHQNGLDPSMLKLEVTESAYTDNAAQVIKVVEGLRAKGYLVEMDDFGTGYSSLNMLSSMPIDVLKMDRAFIQNMENNEKDIRLVALIIGIAQELNVPVVAEGVERESELQLLKQLGCTLVQGYYFSRPLDPSDFEKLIISEHGLDQQE